MVSVRTTFGVVIVPKKPLGSREVSIEVAGVDVPGIDLD